MSTPPTVPAPVELLHETSTSQSPCSFSVTVAPASVAMHQGQSFPRYQPFLNHLLPHRCAAIAVYASTSPGFAEGDNGNSATMAGVSDPLSDHLVGASITWIIPAMHREDQVIATITLCPAVMMTFQRLLDVAPHLHILVVQVPAVLCHLLIRKTVRSGSLRSDCEHGNNCSLSRLPRNQIAV